ncbi:MAG TPA: peptide chain release factor 2 [Lentisphaeria bacterium]|nr:MAG: peptide chain release factor 2 [Lentisphaerae bacterium GWF2_38_69]HBM15646.1 peptide chain release factor 2 [Lentisphaeria bacterium]
MTLDELKNTVNDAKERTVNLRKFLKVEEKIEIKKEIENKMLEANFWDSREKAQSCMNELSSAKTIIDSYNKLSKDLEDFTAMAELVIESPTEDMLEEAETLWNEYSQKIDKVELISFLSGKYDKNNAYITIHAGAGGTESCDWASMLLRMYRRWFERRGWSDEIIDFQPGEEAGIKSVTILVKGTFAYGYSKAERGIHRLVRISPFDSNARRHTSFASVEAMPEFEEDNDEIEIDEKDLRVDTYRSSGAGGQHVNKTDSAIRLTHLPTGIVVACQTERSQHKNRSTAMKMLRAKLFALKEDEKAKEASSISSEKTEMGWGYQIRSYVLHPYQMVKDLRTAVETGNTGAVLDGDIDQFVEAWVKNKHLL